jgi:hypothetical protein
MPLILTTGFATQLAEWLITESVETAAGAAVPDVFGGAPSLGPIAGLTTLAVAIGSAAAGALLSVGPRRVLTFGAAPVWGTSEPLAIVTVLSSSMLISPCSVHLDHHQLPGGLGSLYIGGLKVQFFKNSAVG